MVYRLAIESIVVTIVIHFIIAYLPTDILFNDFRLEPVNYEPVNAMKITWNTFLSDNAELLLKDKIIGPESIAVHGEHIYTGLADGRLIAINKRDQSLREITRFTVNELKKRECYDNNFWSIEKCGRPLGLRFDDKGTLYVIDAVTGFYRVNVETGQKELIALGRNDKNLPSKWSGLYNDFVFDVKDPNIVYVTVSSRKWSMRHIFWSIFEHDSTGCLLAVHLKTGFISKISDGFFLANSVEISADKKYLLLSETNLNRILKYNLNDIREQLSKGKLELTTLPEVFIENLPGPVDNVRLHNGNLYVAFALTKFNENKFLSEQLAQWPMIRKTIGRIVYLSSLMVKYVHKYLYQHPIIEELEYNLNSGIIFYSLVPKCGSFIVLDGNTGEIKQFLGSDAFSFISEVAFDKETGDIYFGSFRNQFLGKISSKVLANKMQSKN